jgi:hypothetical protein
MSSIEHAAESAKKSDPPVGIATFVLVLISVIVVVTFVSGLQALLALTYYQHHNYQLLGILLVTLGVPLLIAARYCYSHARQIKPHVAAGEFAIVVCGATALTSLFTPTRATLQQMGAESGAVFNMVNGRLTLAAEGYEQAYCRVMTLSTDINDTCDVVRGIRQVAMAPRGESSPQAFLERLRSTGLTSADDPATGNTPFDRAFRKYNSLDESRVSLSERRYHGLLFDTFLAARIAGQATKNERFARAVPEKLVSNPYLELVAACLLVNLVSLKLGFILAKQYG